MTQDTGPALSIVVACCAQSACTGSRQHMQPTGAWKIPITGESQPNRHFISAKSDCEAFIHNVIQSMHRRIAQPSPPSLGIFGLVIRENSFCGYATTQRGQEKINR